MYENEESPCRKKMKKKILSAPYIFVKAIITSHITLIFKGKKTLILFGPQDKLYII